MSRHTSETSPSREGRSRAGSGQRHDKRLRGYLSMFPVYCSLPGATTVPENAPRSVGGPGTTVPGTHSGPGIQQFNTRD